MTYGVAIVLLFSGMKFAHSEETILPHEAKDHIGEITMVCGAIVGIRQERQPYHPEFKDQTATPSNLSLLAEHTILFFNKRPPEHSFMAIFDDAYRREFAEAPDSFVGRQACVFGKIVNYKGKQAIVIFRTDQLSLEHMATVDK